ncbi:alpha-(1,6)-fucosyltransferase-like [Saccostrea echinata]|uniref:alpha-(1,6)-fucosyltransferase-like n=1 Tax=Saccostrea echinata TaxID=191078 RepID=UPI002A7F6C1B|nr:alpha-(1,6)-fucosyltransferase-like [Saccostrea echinata]
MKAWKVIVALLALWLLIMIYMSNTVFQPSDGNLALERELKQTLRQLDKLKAQNEEFQNLANDIRKLSKGSKLPLKGGGSDNKKIRELQDKLERMSEQLRVQEKVELVEKAQEDASVSLSVQPTKEHEVARRRVENTAAEFWYYMRHQLLSLKNEAEGNTNLVSHINKIIGNAHGYQRTLNSDFLNLRSVDGMEQWRKKESQKLTDLVQRRFHYLQNPKDCSKAKKVVCNLSKGCGYGCQLHHVVYCMMVGYATGRTLILESQGWRYASAGWESVFQPLSNTCTKKDGTSSEHWKEPSSIEHVQVIEMPIIDSLHPRPNYLPLSFPKDLADRLIRLHGDPTVWWIGQFVKYLTRPQPHLKQELERAKQKLNFVGPIVGVHIRRTDKLAAEASFHSVAEYMTYVEDYFSKLEQRIPGVQRKVFLASDDPTALPEAKKNYPDYTFISDPAATLSAGLNRRYSDESLRGVILDIHFLSLCDHLVCTFSSQVCRVAYEMMQTMHGDATSNFKSLDDIYYFGGQNGHSVEAVERHVKQNDQEIDLEPGDMVGIAGNHWDGYSKGMNHRTGKTGLFPSYKTREKYTIVDLPKYPEVSEDG